MRDTCNWYGRCKTARGLPAAAAAAMLAGGMAFSAPASGGVSFTPSAGFRDVLTRHEGYRAKPYKDSKGVLTVGIGFNLERSNAAALLEAEGISLKDVVAGRRPITKDEAWRLAARDLKTAVADARILFPNFDSLPDGVQEVLVNMSFNMGRSSLSKFKKMRAAVASEDFGRAADEMLDSRWAGQVGGRAVELAGQMRRGGASAPPPPSTSAGGRVPSPPSSPPPTGGGGTVTVTSGDTLSGIARKHLRDPSRWEEIARLNGIKDPRDIRPGQKLRLP
jgi:lysozyme